MPGDWVPVLSGGRIRRSMMLEYVAHVHCAFGCVVCNVLLASVHCLSAAYPDAGIPWGDMWCGSFCSHKLLFPRSDCLYVVFVASKLAREDSARCWLRDVIASSGKSTKVGAGSGSWCIAAMSCFVCLTVPQV